jgi:hypothetical protein
MDTDDDSAHQARQLRALAKTRRVLARRTSSASIQVRGYPARTDPCLDASLDIEAALESFIHRLLSLKSGGKLG